MLLDHYDIGIGMFKDGQKKTFKAQHSKQKLDLNTNDA